MGTSCKGFWASPLYVLNDGGWACYVVSNQFGSVQALFIVRAWKGVPY